MKTDLSSIILVILSVGIMIASIFVLKKINKDCQSHKANMMKNLRNVKMDIQIDPARMDASKPSLDEINQCNSALQYINQSDDGNPYQQFDKSSGMKSSYYCYGKGLVDAASDDLCNGAAAIVPDNFGGEGCPPYRGSCSRPLLSGYNSNSAGLDGYLCTTKDKSMSYPIATDNCGGSGEANNAIPCRNTDKSDFDLPPGVGFC